MKRILILGLSLLCLNLATAQPANKVKRPKLVVGIVIDQMRWDYLYRYYSRYTDDGFKRLMNEGYNCQNTFINYLPSFTAPGHACVYTGSVPSIHGIASNDWIDNATGASVYCVEDKTVHAIDGRSAAGKMSPANLWTTTVTDELKLATNNRSRVYGISIKDRGAILPAGHMANGAYWFDDSTGNFMSSSFYGTELPAWLRSFNNKHWADTLMNSTWDLLYPAHTYRQGTADNSPYEGVLKGESAPVFPHNAPKGAKGYNALRYFPGGNSIVFKAAKACIKGTELGQGSTTDFLCLSFSSTDYAGHTFGPNSIEAEDMYLRLDKDLASFLRFLDAKVGEGNYTIFLTADHGAAHNTSFMTDRKVPAGDASEAEVAKALMKYVKDLTGKDSLIRALGDYQVYLNEPKFHSAQERNEVKKMIVDWLYKQEGVAYVVDMENMNTATVPEPLRSMIVNGYNRQRSGCIQIVLKPGWYSGGYKTGTTHGTWNPYDTHIPLLWYGWGIANGETYRKTNMTDIAATVSALLHIQMPNGCIGNTIEEVLK